MYLVSIGAALAAFILVLCAAQGVRMVSYDAAQSLSMEEDVAVQEKGSLIIKVVDRYRDSMAPDNGRDWKVD